jgi:hypothetical protein
MPASDANFCAQAADKKSQKAGRESERSLQLEHLAQMLVAAHQVGGPGTCGAQSM